MKIGNNPNIQKVLGAYKSKMTNVNKTEKTIQSKDKVEISQKAIDFQVAMKAFKELPDIRENKVNDVKQAIKSGTYNPSAKEVVDKMIDSFTMDKKI